jgi:flagellin-like hook-associated protein FlgL
MENDRSEEETIQVYKDDFEKILYTLDKIIKKSEFEGQEFLKEIDGGAEPSEFNKGRAQFAQQVLAIVFGEAKDV